MNIRSILLSSVVICAGVLVFDMSQSHAASAVSPLGNWSVSKVDARQVGSAPYCALNRRFSNGSLVTFARNTNNEISLAMDFPKSTLKTDQTAKVVFDAGAGEVRDFKTTPVSERGVVVRMGQDDKFFDALAKSGQLTVKVDSHSLTFAMPDIESGAADLSACLGPMTEPAAGEFKASLTPITEVREVEMPRAEPIRIAQMEELSKQPIKPIDLSKASKPPKEKAKETPKAKVELAAASEPLTASASSSSMDMELQTVKEENIRLKNALERERRTYEDKFAQMGGDTSLAAEMQEKMRLLQTENEKLRNGGKVDARAPTCPVVPAAATSISGSDKEITALKSENTKLKSDIADAKTQIETLEASVKSAKASTPVKEASSSGELNAAKKKASEAEMALSSMRDQLARLEDENRSLRSAAGPMQAQGDDTLKQNVATIARLSAVEAQFNGLRAERDRLASELESVRNVEGDARVKIASDNWDLEKATKRYNEAEREIRRLGSALESERAKCTVEKKDLEFMLFDPKVAEKEQITKLIRLEEQLNVAQNELTTKNSGDKEKVSALEKRVRDLESGIAAESSKISTAESRARDLEQQLAQAKAGADQKAQAQISANSEKLGVYEGQIKDLEARVAVETQKTVSAETRLRDLEQQLAQTKLTAEQQAQAKITAASDKLALAEKQLKDLDSRTAAESQKAMSAEARIAEMQKQITAAQAASDARVAQLQLQLATAQNAGTTQLSDMQRQMSAAQAASDARVAELQQQLTMAQNNVTATSTLAQTNGEKVSAYEAQINGLTQQLAAATTNAAQFQADLQQAQTQNASAANDRVMIDTLKKEIASLNTQLDNVQNERSALATQMAQINTAAGDATRASRLSATPQSVSQAVNPVEVDRVSGMPARTISNPVPVTATVMATPPAAVVASAPTVRLMGKSDIEGLLSRAGVEISGGVQTLGGASTSRVAYRWQTSGLFGTAEQKPMETPQQFDRFVQDYLNKTKSRCPGQFAAVPALLESTSAGQIASYEIACVDNAGSGASAALIFSGRDQVFTTIAHEAAPESMDFAMDARDRLLSVMHAGKAASR